MLAPRTLRVLPDFPLVRQMSLIDYPVTFGFLRGNCNAINVCETFGVPRGHVFCRLQFKRMAIDSPSMIPKQAVRCP
jgi:hypothetical protein